MIWISEIDEGYAKWVYAQMGLIGKIVQSLRAALFSREPPKDKSQQTDSNKEKKLENIF